MQRILASLFAVSLLLVVAPDAGAQDFGGEFVPSFDDEASDEASDDDFGGEFVPTFDDDEDDEDADEEEADETEEDGAGGEFVPTWDDDGGDAGFGGDFAPSFDDEDDGSDAGFGGEFAPSFDEEDDGGDAGFGGEFAPSFDDEDDGSDAGFGGEFVPSRDEEDDGGDAEFGGDFVPSFDDDDDGDDAGFGGDFAPSFDDEAPDDADDDAGFGGDFAPSIGADDTDGDTEEEDFWWLEGDDSDATAEDEVDWDSYWDELESDEIFEGELPAEDAIAEDMGRLQGVVVSDDGGDPLYGTEVTLENTAYTLTTGDNGVFFFDVEPGTYVLRLRNLAYKPEGFEVIVEPGSVTDLSEIRLVVDNERTMTLVVEARADTESTATQLRERRDSSTVQDAVSAEQISRSGDSSASSALARVVGVTIVDSRFLFVRGLGGRYTAVTLNGVPVPQTDPFYPGIELDVFPSDLLANLTLYKTFTPDLQGGFTGGMVDIRTRSFPEEFTFNVSGSVGGDFDSTFRNRLTYEGGGMDWLGFDDGTRAIPDAIPSDDFVSGFSEITGTGYTREERYAMGRELQNVWNFQRRMTPPSFGLKSSIGDTIEFESGDRLGYLALVRYSRDYDIRTAQRNRLTLTTRDGEESVGLDRFPDFERGIDTTQWGALGTLSWSPAENHDLTLLTMWNQKATDTSRRILGYSRPEDEYLDYRRLQFVQRSLSFTELVGSHRRLLQPASPLHETSFDWHAAYAFSQRYEPGTRFLERETRDPDLVPYEFRPDGGSGEHLWIDYDQSDVDIAVDLRLPWLELWALKAGGEIQYSDRTYDSRRFRIQRDNSDPDAEPLDFTLDPEVIFDPSNHGPGGLVLFENTQATDAFTSNRLIVAGYGDFDLRITDWMRAFAGARYEAYSEEIISDSVAPPDEAERFSRSQGDILPAGGLVFAPADDMNIRASYGATVARPQITEVAPLQQQDYSRRRTITGNPDLEQTRIHNVDLRYEWFPTPTEVLSGTLFYKNFRSPIELVAGDSAGQSYTFQNALSAANYGIETEAVVSLGYLADPLRDVELGLNASYIVSQIELRCTPLDGSPGECEENYTNTERAMAGQSPWVVNATLGWAPEAIDFSTTALYNVLGPRIDEVGLEGRPDLYELPRHQLDLVTRYNPGEHWGMSLKFSNLLAQDRRIGTGPGEDLVSGDPLIVEQDSRPVAVSFGLSWSY